MIRLGNALPNPAQSSSYRRSAAICVYSRPTLFWIDQSRTNLVMRALPTDPPTACPGLPGYFTRMGGTGDPPVPPGHRRKIEVCALRNCAFQHSVCPIRSGRRVADRHRQVACATHFHPVVHEIFRLVQSLGHEGGVRKQGRQEVGKAARLIIPKCRKVRGCCPESVRGLRHSRGPFLAAGIS